MPRPMVTALVWRVLRQHRTLSLAVGTLVELAVLAFLIVCMWYSQPWADSARGWAGQAGAVWIARGGAVCLPCAALILVMALEVGAVARLLAWPILVFLGEISYSIYLIHKTLIEFYRINPRLFTGMSHDLAYALFWAATIGLAALIWLIVERPCRRFLVGLWPRRSAVATPPRSRVTTPH